MNTAHPLITYARSLFRGVYVYSHSMIMLLAGHYTCIKIKKHTYDIHYMINLQKYTLRVIHRPGPSPYISFTTMDGRDVTSTLMAYAGPSYDFHGVEYTPRTLGFDDGLVVTFRNLLSFTYGPDDIIGD
jgi:hypothetical protein